MSVLARSHIACMTVLGLLLSAPTLAAPASAFAVGPDERVVFSSAKTWTEGVEHIRQGQFAEARTVLTQLASRCATPDVAKGWMADWLEAEKSRRALTEKDYDDYVERAIKWRDRNDVNKALKWAYYSMLNAADADTFRREAWVQELKRIALDEADKQRLSQEWRDAHVVYYSLSLIFEDDEDVDQRRKECLEHARLDEIYNTERDWKDSLEGIDQEMVEEALWRVDQKYVEEADFRSVTLAGFEELLLFGASPTMGELFEGLGGERGEQFAERLKLNLERIKAQPRLTYRDAKKYFRRALKINRQTAQIPEEVLVREYANAALDELDEFSSMIWPHDFREFEKHTRGDFIGVGIQIRNRYNPDLKDSEILVVSPLEDTPAYRAGIQAEDVITKVDGDSLLGVLVTKAVGMITGPKGTTVVLTVRREMENGSEKELDFPLKRDKIEIQSVKSLKRQSTDEQRWDFIQDPQMGIAYVRVNSFQENTVSQLRAALSEARAQGMRGLILDLRYNPGGLLKSAIQMSELFLEQGERIVSTKGLRSREWTVDVERDGRYTNLPLIILINESSASASEIVSGAIKDHGRGLVIGERSFGKFSVQNLIPLMNNSEAHLKLTTARYYLPSGRSLHREKTADSWGVEPDIVVPLVPKEQSKIIFMRRDADVIGAVKTSSEAELDEPVEPRDSEDKDGDADDQVEAPDPNERPRRDPQIETALLVMRLHLLSDAPQMMAEVPSPAKTKMAHD